MIKSLVERFTEELQQYPPMGESGHVYTITERVWACGDYFSYRLTVDGKPSVNLGSLWHLARFRKGYLAAVSRGKREAPYKAMIRPRGSAVFPESVAATVWLEGHDLATGNDSTIDPTGASSYCNPFVYPRKVKSDVII